MSPDQMIDLLSRVRSPADVVEAIDDPELQRLHGWDLANWTYELVPWGVRFLFREPGSDGQSEIVVLVAAARRPDGHGDSRPQRARDLLARCAGPKPSRPRPARPPAAHAPGRTRPHG